MQKIDKSDPTILSIKYKKWLTKMDAKNEVHNKGYRYYYDDIIMNLYRCQSGVCAYTEMFICIPSLYREENWESGRYKIPPTEDFTRLDHLGEMDHFDPRDKELHYWNWDNLFMIHAKINSIKTNYKVVDYLKPDLSDYNPEKYFDYDHQTHLFIPNTDITDPKNLSEIQHMIDNVLCLNHGVVRNERRDYINLLKDKKQRNQEFTVDRFFTAVKWTVTK